MATALPAPPLPLFPPPPPPRVYGGDTNVRRWQYFFSRRSELAGWHVKKLGGFGDVSAVLFENPDGQLRGVASEQNFVSLFDGHTLKGWDGDPTRWRVSDGAIVAQRKNRGVNVHLHCLMRISDPFKLTPTWFALDF